MPEPIDVGRYTTLRAEGGIAYDPKLDSGILTPPRLHQLDHRCKHEEWQHSREGACYEKGCLCKGRWTHELL